MKPTNTQIKKIDQITVANYQTQLHQAGRTPWLAAILLKRARLFSDRLNYFYQTLARLPRQWRRQIKKLLAARLVGAALMLAFGPTPSVHAATITVSTNTAPLADDGFCSLTEAILNANSDSQIYTTVGECDAGSGPDIINLAGNTYTYSAAYNGSNALPAINGELVIVNTKFCTLCTIEPDHSFNPFWRPSFVSALAPQDRCHLNGLAMLNGKPKFVTALGETDTPGGWRENKRNGGLLIDVERNEILLRGLSMPHFPRVYDNKLWIMESGEGSLAVVNLEEKSWYTVTKLPGFTRGISFAGPLAFIGLSQVRESAVFSGIPLVERLEERTCGIWVVNLQTAETIGFIRFEEGVQEIFAVQVLSVRYPELLEFNDQKLMNSYVIPEQALQQVPVQNIGAVGEEG